MKLTKLTLILLVLMAATPLTEAASKEKAKKPFDLKRHEFTITTAYVPGRYGLNDYKYNYYGYTYEPESMLTHWELTNAFERTKYYEREYTSGAWALGYTYNFTKILSIQAHAFFEMGWNEKFSRADNSLIHRQYDMYISVMPSFKVHWFNRNWIRMYSYAGLGLSFNSYKVAHGYDTDGVTYSQALVPAWQVTPFGLTVGKKLYGVAEIGIGNYFSGISFGIGYRF